MKDRLEIAIDFPKGEKKGSLEVSGSITEEHVVLFIKVLEKLIKELENKIAEDEI